MVWLILITKPIRTQLPKEINRNKTDFLLDYGKLSFYPNVYRKDKTNILLKSFRLNTNQPRAFKLHILNYIHNQLVNTKPNHKKGDFMLTIFFSNNSF